MRGLISPPAQDLLRYLSILSDVCIHVEYKKTNIIILKRFRISICATSLKMID